MTLRPMAPLPWLATVIIDTLAPADWREAMTGDLIEERARRQAAGRSAGSVWTAWRAARASFAVRADRRRGLAPTTGHGIPGWSLDVRQTLRGLSSQRGYAITAVGTLAIGIGATTSVFGLANGLLFRPIAGVMDQARLVTLFFGKDGAVGPISVAAVDGLAASAPALAGVAGTAPVSANVEAGGAATRVDAEVVSGNYFDVLNGAVGQGRGFTVDEGRDPGAAPVAVVSDAFWRASLGADPRAVGSTIRVNGDSWTIVGVAVRGFRGPSRTARTDLWVPVAQFARVLPGYRDVMTSLSSRAFHSLVGRLADGATAAGLTAQAEVVRRAMSAAKPADFQLKNWRFSVHAGLVDGEWIRRQLGGSLALVAGFVALLLVITCTNVGNLLFMRATSRRAELATHVALGASRARVVRLLLGEATMLAAMGAVLALALTVVAGRILAGTIVLQGVPPIDPPPIDLRVFLFAAGIAAVAALSAGVLPAIAGSRADPAASLRDSTRSHTNRRARLRRAMAAVQVGTSLLLILAAMLLTRSMSKRNAVDPGFDASRVLAFSVEPRLQRYDDVRQHAFYRQLLDRLRAVPGVRTAGVAWLQPFSRNAADQGVRAEEQPASATVEAENNVVSDGMIGAVGLQIVQGRDFTAAEQFAGEAPGSPVIISASLAHALFGGANAVGRRLALQYSDGATRTVVGVVSNMRQRRLLEPPEHMIFEPMTGQFGSWSTILIGFSGTAAEAATAAARVVASIDPAMPIYHVVTLRDEIDRQLAGDRLLAVLARVFAAMATVLAAVGLYGVLARAVAERRREFGIRLALGARPVSLAGLVARDTAGMLALGLALGAAASLALSRYLESSLYDVQASDPASAVAAAALLVTIAAVATQPAIRRTSRIDPAETLRV